MIGEICIYSGKLFIPYSSNKVLFVKVYEYCENAEEHFWEIFESKFQPKEDVDISYCGMRSIGDTLSNTVSLFVVVRFETGKVNVLHCVQHRDSFDLSEVDWFTSANIICSSNNIWLVDGPQLAVVNDTELCLLCTSSVVKTYDMKKVLTSPISYYKIINFSLVNYCNTFNGAVSVHLLIISSIANSWKEKVNFLLCIQITNADEHSTNFYPVETSLFFSENYSCQATSVSVHIKPFNFGEIMQSGSILQDVLQLRLKENRTILCVKKLCLVFHKGYFQCRCNIPFSDVSSIRPLPVFCCESQNQSIILWSPVAGACHLNFKNKNMKSVKEWRDVVTLTTGCILGNGAEQFLLLHSADPHNWQNYYSFADVNLPSTYHMNMNLENVSSSDCLKNALPGLEKRVMTGKATVTELQYRISEKQAAISNALKMLCGHGATNDSVTSGADISFLQKSLVNILPLSGFTSVETENDVELKLPIEVTDEWKTVLSGNCIFGWTFKNTSDKTIMNPKMHLVIEGMYEKTTQKVFAHPSEGQLCQPRSCDPSFEQEVFKHGDTMSIVLCFAVPMFLSKVMNAFFILTWSECRGEACQKFSWISSLETNAYHQINIKSTTMCSTDLLKESQLQGLSVVSQLLSFRVLQQRNILLVSVAHSIISDFENTLKSSDKQNIPVLIYHLGVKLLIFNDSQSVLYGINMSWEQLDKTNFEITVYTRNTNEIILFTHWLYIVLPVDVLVLPRTLKRNHVPEFRKEMLVSIGNETALILDYLYLEHYYIDTQEDMKQSGTEQSQSSKIVLTKEKFLEMRKSLLEKEMLTDYLVSKLYCY